MHDPMTVAFRIESPFRKVTKFGTVFRKTLITIWHVDPETDGSDDSCGWFKRAHHGDKEVLEKIVSDFLFNFKHNYWFTANGYRHFSTSGLLLEMYRTALWQVFKQSRRKSDQFIRKHLLDILHFAENPTDCIGDTITCKYGGKITEETMRSLASCIYGDIIRKTQKWYKHPRWHIHHWKIQIHWPRLFYRKISSSQPCDDNLRTTV